MTKDVVLEKILKSDYLDEKSIEDLNKVGIFDISNPVPQYYSEIKNLGDYDEFIATVYGVSNDILYYSISNDTIIEEVGIFYIVKFRTLCKA